MIKHLRNFLFLCFLGSFSFEEGLLATTSTYETYLESWDGQWESAMTGLPPTPSTSPTSYNNVILNIAFASYTFPGLNGVQFPDVTADTQQVINYVHSQNGRVKISYGGASYAGPNYFISQTQGWPDNIPSLVSGVTEVVNSYGFDGVDFDIEDPLPAGTTAQQFADQLYTFLSGVRQALPEKIISLTIPGQGWNTYWEILAKQVAATNTVNYINFMEYDIWIGASSYVAQIEADIITYTSPTNTNPAPNYAPGWGIPANLIQLGLMPGNDDGGQYLSLSDANTLTLFAITEGLVGVMTWDLDRDAGTNPTPPLGTPPYAYSNEIRDTLYAPPQDALQATDPAINTQEESHRHGHHRHQTEPAKFKRQLPPLHGAPGNYSPEHQHHHHHHHHKHQHE